MQILHTSDWHLREKDYEEGAKCLTFLVETARKEAVDLIVVAGDIFDSQDIKLDSKSARLAIQTVSALANIAPVAIVIGTPSHDGQAPEILGYARGTFPVLVAASPQQTCFYESAFRDNDMQDGRPQAIITLIPQPTKQFFDTSSGVADSDREIGAAMSALFSGFGAQAFEVGDTIPHILVGHWNVSGSTLSNGQVLVGLDIEVSVEQMLLAKPTLVLLGHIHAAQQLGERSFYSGSLYHTNWGEDHQHGFYIHEVTV